MKLHELHINDFKFFPEVEQDSPLLKIDGNHLLIYGENGSGKSTIYWALYTLLEASLKKSDEDIKKYFKKRNNDSLVNIHSTGKNNSFVKAVLKDDQNNSKTFRLSLKKTDLSIRGKREVVESSMATDFINYRVLFQLHNQNHSKENNLWQWFEEEVLQYVKKGAVPCLNELEELKKGPEKIRNLQGEEVFPTAALRTAPTIAERKDYQKYKIYKQKVKAWNNWLEGFLSEITDNANKLIEQEFKYNFKIKLEVEAKFPEFIAEDEKIKWFNPKIIISIPEYEGIQNPIIKKPHTFLNEAKWSAIGLSLRFAILDTKLDDADLKCLVIDDMILSLDMSNRDVVIDILLSKYIDNYQLILMTHDRFFFELVKYKISQLRLTKWKYFEMFEHNNGTISIPLIIEGTSKISKVWILFNRKEFALAANTLRKAAEKLCKAYLTAQERLNANYSIKNLHQMIEAFIRKGTVNGLDANKLTKLLEYKDRILNPNSHYDIETPLFKNELKKAIEIVEEIAIDTGIIV